MTLPCATVNPDVFFPGKGCSPREAQRLCGLCPAKTQCLTTAIESNETLLGIWGGTTEMQRRTMRRGRANA